MVKHTRKIESRIKRLTHWSNTITVSISAAPRGVHSNSLKLEVNAVVSVELMFDNYVCTKHLTIPRDPYVRTQIVK